MTESTDKNLRSFLIFITILGAGIGPHAYRAEDQRAVVQWVKDNGGVVRYQYEIEQDGSDLPSPEPPGPIWLMHEILGVDFLERVVGVDLTNSQVSDLTPLASLTNLEKLTLNAFHSARH